MADDAGALLVRSGLVSSSALDEARAFVEEAGGTVGEHLVASNAVNDDALTEFYRQRLLVPQVNPNTLARLPARVVAAIPADMAIELRAIPVSLDGDNNLTVAMSDPSDRHAVDEIALFTGAYVVRAVATQMQIAWCLAHYYGHVTALGQRLLHASDSPIKAALAQAEPRPPRAKGLTGKVDAARHRAIAPVTGPVDVQRPNSGELDLRPLRAQAAVGEATPATPIDLSARSPGLVRSVPRPSGTPVQPMKVPTVPRAAPDAPTMPPTHDEPTTTPEPDSDGAPDRPRARSVSGEIRVPVRRAASIRPPMPEPELDESDEPDIVIEPPPPVPPPDPDATPSDDDMTGVRKRPLPRRRAVKSDPPELYARAGEVDLKDGNDRRIDADEPRIVIDEDALSPATQRIGRSALIAAKTQVGVPPPATLPENFGAPSEPLDDADTSAVIHDRIIERSEPVLLDRRRPLLFRPLQNGPSTSPLPKPDLSDAGDDPEEDLSPPPTEQDEDTGEVVLVLEAPRPRSLTPPRADRRTQVGIGPAPAARPHRDTEATGIPAMMEHDPSDATLRAPVELGDRTMLDVRPAAPVGDETSSDQLAAPPRLMHPDDTNPHVIAPPPRPAPRVSQLQRAVLVEDGDDDEDGDDVDTGENEKIDKAELELDTGEHPRRTLVMSSSELDAAVPERAPSPPPAATARPIDYDPLDDGWGPPGTTIPPPLLGAIPGSEDDDAPNAIPMSNVDSSPLLVGPPTVSANGDAGGLALARALEDATARALDVIRQLEHAQSRDDVVAIMISHLAETHHRAGFFVTRPSSDKSTMELGLFTMTPKPAVMPFAMLRLDRPSTLQDVVGTRLPYRGPMHDDASRSFLISVLGACPAEILLVPVAVRERVVGVLFGEHRQRHTFDDQVAMAARAAGMALERILKSKRH